MTLQTAGKDHRPGLRPSRQAGQASPARQRQGRGGRRPSTRPRGRQCADRPRRIHLRPAPDPRSARLGRVAPHFALTLRAMFGTRQVSTRPAGRSVLALSVLALLAFGCFPILAHADSSGIQYSDAPPTATGNNTIPTRSAPSAHSPKATGSTAAPAADGSGHPGKRESSAGDSSTKSGDASGAAGGGGTGQQGSPGQGATGGSNGQHANSTAAGGKPSSSQSDDGSSPLVPILIAVAALAAISIGVVMTRQRRRRSGVSVSPKAS